MQKKSKPIDSMKRLQKRLPVILDALGKDQRLFAGALANPVLAIEEIGYTVPAEFRRELENYLRFPEDTRRTLEERLHQVFEAAGEHFDISDPGQLGRVLFEKLALPRPQDHDAGDDRGLPANCRNPVAPPAPGVFGRNFNDPLASLEEAHPIMKPLLEYRRLESSEPRFASASLYRRIRQGDVELPVHRLRFRLGHDRQD